MNFLKIDKLTNIIMKPKAGIATFWTTHFRYYIISKVDENHSMLRIGNN